MPLRAVFFDIDGTLVDSNEFHVMAWQEAFHAAGYQIGTDKIRLEIGKGADQLIPSLIPQVDGETCEALAKRHGEIFRTRYLDQVKAFPNAADLIEMLHAKGIKVLLASSSAKAEVEHYSHMLKVQPLLAGTVSIDDVESSKPAGGIFAAALGKVFPMAAGETFAIGDTPYDVESARQSNIKTIAVRSGGFSGETLAEAGASYIYASVKELFDQFSTSPFQG